MEGQLINTHISVWLKEDKNPYIGIKRSWEEYCKEELDIPVNETIGSLLSNLQIIRLREKHLEEAIKHIQKQTI